MPPRGLQSQNMGLVNNCLTPRYISARCILNIAEKLFDLTQIQTQRFNLCILLTHLYTEFQFKMSICNGDNKRNLKINGIFLSPRGITLPKIIRMDPNLNSTCVFSRNIYILNFNSKCQFVMEIMSGN